MAAPSTPWASSQGAASLPVPATSFQGGPPTQVGQAVPLGGGAQQPAESEIRPYKRARVSAYERRGDVFTLVEMELRGPTGIRAVIPVSPGTIVTETCVPVSMLDTGVYYNIPPHDGFLRADIPVDPPSGGGTASATPGSFTGSPSVPVGSSTM